MNRYLLSFILSTIICLFLIGCGMTSLQTPLIYEKDIKYSNIEYAFVLVGLAIGEGFIDEMSSTLFVNGELIANYGIVIDNKYTEKDIWSPDTQLVFEGNLLRTHADKKTYRLWKIDKKYISDTGTNCIYYISSAGQKHEDSDITIFHRRYMSPFLFKRKNMNGYPMPIEASQNRNKDGLESWDFLGNSFKITKPGIYYLGDVKIKGRIIRRNIKQNHTLFVKTGKSSDLAMKFNQEISVDLSSAKLYIAGTNLSKIQL